jgi:Fe-S cluster assembly protein SufD
MSQTATVLPYDNAGFEAFLKARQEPGWLTTLRRQSWSSFETSDWPERRGEDWSRSDLRPFRIQRYGFAVELALSEPAVADSLLQGVQTAGEIQVHDGAVARSHLNQDLAKRGVVFGSLEQSAQEQGDLVRRHLFQTMDRRADRFAMLQSAAWTGGQFLYVPRGLHVEMPFHIGSFLHHQSSEQGHTLLVLEEGAQATVLMESRSESEGAAGFSNQGLEIVVKPGAHLRFVSLQDLGREVWHFAHQRAWVDRDATLQWTIAALGCRFSQVSQQVALSGPGAYSQVNGVMFTRDRQQLTYNTLQRHAQPHCRSDFLYKAALQDRSRTVWRGMIQVDPGAIKTDGYQRNDNLLLSDQARADSIPGLEILADDVRCTHGSTSGKVDEELIFYACTRGFTRQEAIRMIVTGFFQQIFDRITIASVREALAKAIARQVREYE